MQATVLLVRQVEGRARRQVEKVKLQGQHLVGNSQVALEMAEVVQAAIGEEAIQVIRLLVWLLELLRPLQRVLGVTVQA